jgi:hypothetical protein
MPNPHYKYIIETIEAKFGPMKRIGTGYTLFHIPAIDVFVYLRYSDIANHFFGLRQEDIMLMHGKKSFICLITNDDTKNLFIPFQQFESYFLTAEPAKDGQFKTSSYFKPTGVEVYFAGIGKFSAENYRSIDTILNISQTKIATPLLTHTQVQSLLGSIGIKKGYTIWYPENDKQKIDASIVDYSKIINKMPAFSKEIDHIIAEIDVIWFNQTSPVAFYEVEHSTPIYSGLLRFNDVLLSIAKTDNFSIVADNERENKFSREINRPTFKQNKLIDKVTFLNYDNVYGWHHNLTGVYYGI